MRVLVTGGAGFIGRWVVKMLLDDGHQVHVLDDLSNGCRENLYEFRNNVYLKQMVSADIKDKSNLHILFQEEFDICFHLAAKIDVRKSIAEPRETINDNVMGTVNILEEARMRKTKVVFVSTCHVYGTADSGKPIKENHPKHPSSPYAASKLAAEKIVLTYHSAYGLPVVILRPFNTYGPFQKSTGEGSVICTFIRNKLMNRTLDIHGTGTQTRDFLYVEDCANLIVQSGYSDDVNGQILNAGMGEDISVNALARLIAGEEEMINRIEHPYPESEMLKSICDCSKARRMLGWKPRIRLEEGIKITEEWIEKNCCLTGYRNGR